MTIKELIKQLEELPQDAEVMTILEKKTKIVKEVELVKWNDNIKFVVLHTTREG